MITNLFLSVVAVSASVGLIAAALILAAPLVNKRYAAKWKYFIWIFLALRLILPVGGSDGRSVDSAAESAATREAYAKEPPQWITLEIPGQMAEPVARSFEDNGRGISVLDILSFVWLGGCLCILLFHFFNYFRYRRGLSTAARPVREEAVLCRRDGLLAEMGMKRSVPIVEYGEAASPMLIGFLNPVLVLPRGPYEGKELDFILKHELVHLKRCDVYFKLLLVAANAVHWFNPVIWFMRREAVMDMELSCDEKVIQGAGYAVRKAYTETLMSDLHRNCARKAVLSSQFSGGTQVMKKRFQNILLQVNKKNGILLFLCAVVLTIALGTLMGCSVADSGRAEKDAITGTFDVPDVVLQEAEKWAVDTVSGSQGYDNYSDWRIQSLAYDYTYENFDGMVLQVYRLNCEFWSETPEDIVLAGGRYITEDGWFTADYPNCWYLVFRQEGDSLFFLTRMFENDCWPGDDAFNNDLRLWLGRMEQK